jgi:hypothetical protein
MKLSILLPVFIFLAGCAPPPVQLNNPEIAYVPLSEAEIRALDQNSLISAEAMAHHQGHDTQLFLDEYVRRKFIREDYVPAIIHHFARVGMNELELILALGEPRETHTLEVAGGKPSIQYVYGRAPDAVGDFGVPDEFYVYTDGTYVTAVQN